MTPERFWRCVPCDEILRLAETEGLPADGLLYSIWSMASREEHARFLDAHRSHLVELLIQTAPPLVASGPLWDPEATLWWEVRNATRRFVVEGRRVPGVSLGSSMDQAMIYRCIPGFLRCIGAAVSISADALAAAFDTALYPHVLPEAKLSALTETARRAIHAMDPDSLEVAYSSSTDPSLVMTRLSDAGLVRVLEGVRALLARWEHERVDRHIRRLRDADELLIAVSRRYEISPET
jgi:hypothetical protein